jgi:hypothetical protein
MSGYFRCTDGWLRTHANFPHHAAAPSQALDLTNRGALADALAELSVIEAETAVRTAGGVAARLRTRSSHGRPHLTALSLELRSIGDVRNAT